MYVEVRISLPDNISPAAASKLADDVQRAAMEYGAATTSARLIDHEPQHVSHADGLAKFRSDMGGYLDGVAEAITPFTYTWAPGHNILVDSSIARAVLQRAFRTV
jgi:hypothetical protein